MVAKCRPEAFERGLEVADRRDAGDCVRTGHGGDQSREVGRDTADIVTIGDRPRRQQCCQLNIDLTHAVNSGAERGGAGGGQGHRRIEQVEGSDQRRGAAELTLEVGQEAQPKLIEGGTRGGSLLHRDPSVIGSAAKLAELVLERVGRRELGFQIVDDRPVDRLLIGGDIAGDAEARESVDGALRVLIVLQDLLDRLQHVDLAAHEGDDDVESERDRILNDGDVTQHRLDPVVDSGVLRPRGVVLLADL